MANDPFAGRTHGIPATYNRGCRCPACKEASTNRKRALRKRRAGKVVLVKFEHGASGYKNWDCRCDVCSSAHRAACSDYQTTNRSRLTEQMKGRRQQDPEKVNADNRQRYATTQSKTLDRADRRGQIWTTQEMEIASRQDLSSHEVALLLGRTYAAVATRRKLMKGYEPPASDIKTHGVSGYGRGCRCEACCEAKTKANSDSGNRRALRMKSLPTAKRRGYQWTGPELEIAARDDLTLAQIAERLGRSYSAIVNIRHKLKHDPKTISVAGLSAAPARPDPEEQP